MKVQEPLWTYIINMQTDRKSNDSGAYLTTALLKTITYRILGSLVSFGIGYGYSGLETGLTFGLTDFFLKPLIYFIHEMTWQKGKCRRLDS